MANTTLLNDSVWNLFDEQYLKHSVTWTVTLVVTYTLILVTGIVGNIMVILVVALRPQMRTVTNLFIMNLAVADLFVIVFCVPPTLLANVFTPWILGSFMCKAVVYIQGVSVCASAYSLVAISLDRWRGIYRPLERPRGISKCQALSAICVIWITSILVIIPWAVIFNVITSKADGLDYCVETWEDPLHGKIYFLVANLFFCYFLPLIIISVSNISIWWHVSHRRLPVETESTATLIIKRIHRRARHGVRKMLSIVTLTYLLSWLPLYVLATIVKFSENITTNEANWMDIAMPFAQWLGSWNSCVNPVLYAFLNNKFREMFKSLLPSWLVSCQNNGDGASVINNGNRWALLNGVFKLSGLPSYIFVVAASRNRRYSESRRSKKVNSETSKDATLFMSSKTHGSKKLGIVGNSTIPSVNAVTYL